MTTNERITVGKTVLALALAVASVGPRAARAEATWPTLAQGVNEEGVYQMGEVDSVDLLSGNLSLRVPLGPRYPVGASFSYGLMASYNANAWDWNLEVQGQCVVDEVGGPEFVDFPVAAPDLRSNAGHGWAVSLGSIVEEGVASLPNSTHGYLYTEPDGTKHSFHTQLLGRGVEQNAVMFATDSSFYRLNLEVGENPDLLPASCANPPAGDPQGRCLRLEKPDGTFVELHAVAAGLPQTPGFTRTLWLPTHMGDRHGNFVEVDYLDHSWDVRDSQGRLHRVNFDPATPAREYLRVATVEVAGFGDSLGNPSSTYRFDVSARTVDRHQYRQITLGDLGCAGLPVPDPRAQAQIDQLDRLVLPDGSFYEMTYHATDQAPGMAGAMATLRLPTALRFEYRYSKDWGYGKRIASARHPEPQERVWGVFEKRRYRVESNTRVDMGKWAYVHGGAPFESPADVVVGNPAFDPCYRFTDVLFFTDVTVNPRFATPQRWNRQYYNTAIAGQDGLHSLPFSVCVPGELGDPGEAFPGALRLSREVIRPSDGAVVRSEWVKYEVELPQAIVFPFEGNRRQVWQRTVFDDDPDAAGEGYWTETRFADYDGFGHHEKTIRASNFPGTDGERTVETNYTLGLAANATPPASTPWLLGEFDRVRVYRTPGVIDSETRYCFDGPDDDDGDGVGEKTGFLEGVRKLKGAAAGDHDVLTLFTPDGDGNVEEELFYGGDIATVEGNSACFAGNSTAVYRHVHTYEGGARSGTEALDGDGEVVLRTLDQTIDLASGLVAKSRDAAGIETISTYDAAGRLVGTSAPAGANVAAYALSYQMPTEGNEHAALGFEAKACAPGQAASCSGAAELARRRFEYDRLGRSVVAFDLQPWGTGTAERKREFTYDALDRKSLETEPRIDGDGLPIFSTQYRDFDEFDRPLTVEAPDGRTTTFTYLGGRQETRTVEVRLPEGFRSSTTTFERDGFGRLIRTSEPAGTGGGLAHTTYRYDEGDRLISVCVGDDTSALNGCTGQARSFDFDGRGFLASETHPELDEAVSYGYDPLGNMVRENQPGLADDLLHLRDAAGRVVEIRSFFKVWPPLVENYYARTSSEDGFMRAGKLAQSKRFNRIPSADGTTPEALFIVTETFGYQDSRARLSTQMVRSTQMENGELQPGPSFTTNYTYDALGNVTRLDYPRCDDVSCAGAGTARTVTASYRADYLVGVPTYAPVLAYHSNGALARIEHGNRIWDLRERSASTWKPLEAIVARRGQSGPELWRHGPFEFDGAANIVRIGSESYRYDRMSRLVESTVVTAVGSAQENLSYDLFGNLQAVTRSGEVTEVRNLSPSATSNRLPSSLATYDPRGNVTSWTEAGQTMQYTFDRIGRLQRLRGAGKDRGFAYTSQGERFLTLDFATGEETYTPRDRDQRVLRRVRLGSAGWKLLKDHVYAGSMAVASVVPEGGGERVRHLHLDHLGSTRLVSDVAGNLVGGLTTYYPYGRYAHDGDIGGEELRFTGHERDDVGLASATLDFMHSRYYASSLGRFLSVDPILGSPEDPQSWNRYRYGANNPVGRVDPDGQDDRPVFLRATLPPGLGPGSSGPSMTEVRRDIVNQSVPPLAAAIFETLTSVPLDEAIAPADKFQDQANIIEGALNLAANASTAYAPGFSGVVRTVGPRTVAANAMLGTRNLTTEITTVQVGKFGSRAMMRGTTEAGATSSFISRADAALLQGLDDTGELALRDPSLRDAFMNVLTTLGSLLLDDALASTQEEQDDDEQPRAP